MARNTRPGPEKGLRVVCSVKCSKTGVLWPLADGTRRCEHSINVKLDPKYGGGA